MLVKMSKNLKQRLKVSSLAVPILLIAIYLSQYHFFTPFFVLATAGFIVGALWEYYHITETKGLQPLTGLGLCISCAYTVALFFTTQYPSALIFPYIVLGISLALIFGYALLREISPLITLAITKFGIIYLTVPLSFMIAINFFYPPDATQDGRWWLLYLLTTSKMTDTGAFAVGKTFGKTLLAPVISPRKTWEGAFGGLLAGIGTSLCFYIFMHAFSSNPPIAMTFFQSIWLGAVLSVAAQFGDLAESLLKRDAGVKDSYNLPGLGGILDIVDSLVFTTPLLYLFMYLMRST